jgi:hypothetical protein
MYTGKLLPKCIDLDWTGGFGFSTQVSVMSSGAEQRNQEWQGNRSEYSIAYSARNQEHWSEVRAFIGLHAGRMHTFRVYDPADHVVLASEGVILNLDGVLQMAKRISFEDLAFDVIVTKPGAAVLTGGGTFDPDTGIILTGSPTKWSSPEYYKHCRFDTDRIQLQGISKKKDGTFLAGYHSIPIVEVVYEMEETS